MLRDPDLLGTIVNAFQLVVFFSVVPVSLGLVAATVIHRVATGRLGGVTRTVLFLPQVIPLVAAGIIWGWLLSLPGLVNQVLDAVGLGGVTRAWLGDFDTALPAVGLIGIWVLLGFCTVLLLTGMTKIDPALYESARIDGAGWFREFVVDHAAEPAPGDRRLPHRHRDRRARRVRHRLRLDRRRTRQLDRGARASRSTSSRSSSGRSASRPRWRSCS